MAISIQTLHMSQCALNALLNNFFYKLFSEKSQTIHLYHESTHNHYEFWKITSALSPLCEFPLGALG